MGDAEYRIEVERSHDSESWPWRAIVYNLAGDAIAVRIQTTRDLAVAEAREYVARLDGAADTRETIWVDGSGDLAASPEQPGGES